MKFLHQPIVTANIDDWCQRAPRGSNMTLESLGGTPSLFHGLESSRTDIQIATQVCPGHNWHS